MYLFVVAIAALPLGAILGIVTAGTISLTALSGLAFVRSLRGSYGREKLTTTRWSGSGAGPPRFGGAAIAGSRFLTRWLARYKPVMNQLALSVIPVRRSRFGTAMTVLEFLAFAPNGRMVLGMTGFGATYLLTVGWALWPASGWTSVPWLLVSLAMTAWSIRMLARGVAKARATWGSRPTSPP